MKRGFQNFKFKFRPNLLLALKSLGFTELSWWRFSVLKDIHYLCACVYPRAIPVLGRGFSMCYRLYLSPRELKASEGFFALY